MHFTVRQNNLRLALRLVDHRFHRSCDLQANLMRPGRQGNSWIVIEHEFVYRRVVTAKEVTRSDRASEIASSAVADEGAYRFIPLRTERADRTAFHVAQCAQRWANRYTERPRRRRLKSTEASSVFCLACAERRHISTKSRGRAASRSVLHDCSGFPCVRITRSAGEDVAFGGFGNELLRVVGTARALVRR